VKGYNELLKMIMNSLKAAKNYVGEVGTVEGEKVDENSLIEDNTIVEDVMNALRDLKVPIQWQRKTYATRKPLMNWFKNFVNKVEFMRTWVTEGEPKTFFAPAFISFKGFLSSVLRLYLKDNPVTTKCIDIEFTILKDTEDVNWKKEGVVINGLHLINGTWNSESMRLEDSPVGKIRSKLPSILLKPTFISEETSKGYLCPVYRSTEKGNEPIVCIRLPTDKNDEYWILKETVIVLELDD